MKKGTSAQGIPVQPKVYEFLPDIWEKGVQMPDTEKQRQSATKNKTIEEYKFIDPDSNAKIKNAYNRATKKNSTPFNSSSKGRVESAKPTSFKGPGKSVLTKVRQR